MFYYITLFKRLQGNQCPQERGLFPLEQECEEVQERRDFANESTSEGTMKRFQEVEKNESYHNVDFEKSYQNLCAGDKE